MNDELIAEAELGEEARKFLESDLCQCMLGIANQEAQLALEELGEADPEDDKKIRELQNKVKLANSFQQWLDELIDKGQSALEVWKNGQTRSSE